MQPIIAKPLAALPALFAAAFWLWPPCCPAERQREPEPNAREQRLNQLSVALRDFSYMLVITSDKAETLSRAQRFALTHELIDQRLGLPRGTCENELPEFARVVLKGPHPRPAMSACSQFVLGDLDQAEAAALEGTEEKGAEAFMKALSWRIAADVAMERGDSELALKRIRSAAKFADANDDFSVWSTVQFQLGRLLVVTGEKTEMVKVMRAFQAGTAKHFGRLDSQTLKQHNLLANWFFNFGLYAEAEGEYRTLIKAVGETDGENSEKLQVIRESLAKAIAAQGRKEEAAAVFKSPKGAYSPGPRTKTAASVQDMENLSRYERLGIQMYEQQKFTEAADYFRKSYELSKQVNGAEYSGTLMGQSNLGVALYEIGEVEESVALLRDVVAISERLLPKDDLATIERKNNLANALSKKGDHQEAAMHHRHVAEVRRRELGQDHPKTVDAYNNLAGDLDNVGKPEEAEQLARAVVTSRLRVQGPEHPATLRSRRVLSQLLNVNGKAEEAAEEDRSIVATCVRVFGRDHPDTIAARKDLAFSLMQLGKFEESEKECLEAFTVSQKMLGEEHPLTLECQGRLGDIRVRSGDNVLSLAEAKDLLARKLQKLGPEHPETLNARTSLAHQFHRRGEAAAAEKEYAAVLAAYRRLHQMESSDGLDARNGHALNLRSLNRSEEAVANFRQILKDATRVHGASAPFTVSVMANLALALKDQGQYEEALKLREEELPQRIHSLGGTHPEVIRAYIQMADLLEKMKRPEEARAFMEKAHAAAKLERGSNDLLTRALRAAITDPTRRDSTTITTLLNFVPSDPLAASRFSMKHPGIATDMPSNLKQPLQQWQTPAMRATVGPALPPERLHEMGQMDLMRTSLFPEEATSFEMLKQRVFGP